MENEKDKTVFKEDGPLKHLFVEYVGEKFKPETGEVTVEMIIHALAEEFPELVLVIAQENFLNGYRKAIDDIQAYEENKSKEIEEIINNENKSD